MILEAKVTSVSQGRDGQERIAVTVGDNAKGLDFDTMILPNTDNLKLGDEFLLVMEPKPKQPEPTF